MACFLLMGGNVSKTRALGSWTAPPTATGRGAWTGNSDNPCSCPRNSYAWMVISTQRSELLSGQGIQGLPSEGSAGMCCCLTRLFLMGCTLDTSPGRLQSEMRSVTEVSSDGKLFQKIKKQVGNRAAKQTAQETIALQIGFLISHSHARSPVLCPRDAHGFPPA